MAVDWTQDFAVTFEFWQVDTGTWGDLRRLMTVTEMRMDWDLSKDTLGSASLECAEELGEVYVRAYLLAEQGSERARECLGTFMAQTSEFAFDGKAGRYSADAYTPLLEMSESMPEIGYTTPADDLILERAVKIARQHTRAPVSSAAGSTAKCGDFVANLGDSWLDFASDLLAVAGYRYMVGPRGEVYVQPVGDAASMRPVHTFRDDEISILCPDLSSESDLYGMPNVVEVVYGNKVARAVNDDPDSIISTKRRGREVVKRITNPDLSANPTDEEAQAYAVNELRNLSTRERTIEFSHGYVPNVWLGDCVRVEYKRAGHFENVVIQKRAIECKTELLITETATYTERMWR